MKRIFTALLLTLLCAPAFAQQNKILSPDAPQAQQPAKEPALPPPLKTLSEGGAQVRYLGRENGLDGWITVKEGHTQYFYAPPDQQFLLMGMLFGNDGKLITVRQVKALQDKSGHALDAMAAPPAPAPTAATPNPAQSLFKTPSEQLYDNVVNANWIQVGSDQAPVIYAFVDPQCPHCQDFLKSVKPNFVDNGQVRLRLIPIGFKEDSLAQAAFLLAAPDAGDRLFKFIGGDKTALPVTPGINEQGVERNLAIMQSWHLDVTPFIVYRASNGQVKLVRGKPANMNTLLADLRKK